MRPRLVLALVLVLPACSSSSAPAAASDPTQTPPTTGVDAWLAKGYYQSWRCQPAPHAAFKPSPHGTARVCSNAKVSGHGAGEYPVGAASVVEVFDDAGMVVIGHAVDVHTAAGSSAPSWYFYARDASGVVADGAGDAPDVGTKCEACHSQAGIGYVGHDFVFTQVD